MATMAHHPAPRAEQHRPGRLSHVDLTSAAVLFLGLAGLVLVIVGITAQGSSWFWIIPPLLLMAWAIAHLRRDQ